MPREAAGQESIAATGCRCVSQRHMELRGTQWNYNLPALVSTMTFDDLDGRELTFDDRGMVGLHRPYNRILCLQAKAAKVARHSERVWPLRRASGTSPTSPLMEFLCLRENLRLEVRDPLCISDPVFFW